MQKKGDDINATANRYETNSIRDFQFVASTSCLTKSRQISHSCGRVILRLVSCYSFDASDPEKVATKSE